MGLEMKLTVRCFWCKETFETSRTLKDGLTEEDFREEIEGQLARNLAKNPMADPVPMLGYEYCPSCLRMKQSGIAVVEVDDTPQHNNQPSIVDEPKLYPTGAWAVVRDEPEMRMLLNLVDEDKETGALLNPTLFRGFIQVVQMLDSVIGGLHNASVGSLN